MEVAIIHSIGIREQIAAAIRSVAHHHTLAAAQIAAPAVDTQQHFASSRVDSTKDIITRIQQYASA